MKIGALPKSSRNGIHQCCASLPPGATTSAAQTSTAPTNGTRELFRPLMMEYTRIPQLPMMIHPPTSASKPGPIHCDTIFDLHEQIRASSIATCRRRAAVSSPHEFKAHAKGHLSS